MENKVQLSGRLIKLSKSSTSIHGVIEVQRSSGVCDQIPFITKKDIPDVDGWVTIKGKLQTKNKMGKDNRAHKFMYIWAEEITENSYMYDENSIEFDGVLVRKDVLRRTPKGKVILDAVLAVNDKGVSEYPSVILWEENACLVDQMDIGIILHVKGRFQSREYQKGEETKTAYEISVKTAEVVGSCFKKESVYAVEKQ